MDEILSTEKWTLIVLPAGLPLFRVYLVPSSAWERICAFSSSFHLKFVSSIQIIDCNENSSHRRR